MIKKLNKTKQNKKTKTDLVFKEFYYPEDAGFPIGRADGPKMLILEIRYDNPENRYSKKMYLKKMFLFI